MRHFNIRHLASLFVAIVCFLPCGASGEQFDPAKNVGLHGGLVVQLGAAKTDIAAELSKTGRYLIHVLDTDAQTVRSAQSRLRAEGHYGLAWAEQLTDSKRLPYAENMVNLIVVRDFVLPLKELSRVLTPGGSVAVTNGGLVSISMVEATGLQKISSGSTLILRKP